jgi:hypothetical protein
LTWQLRATLVTGHIHHIRHTPPYHHNNIATIIWIYPEKGKPDLWGKIIPQKRFPIPIMYPIESGGSFSEDWDDMRISDILKLTP